MVYWWLNKYIFDGLLQTKNERRPIQYVVHKLHYLKSFTGKSDKNRQKEQF